MPDKKEEENLPKENSQKQVKEEETPREKLLKEEEESPQKGRQTNESAQSTRQ